jgi:hypothetical protein
MNAALGHLRCPRYPSPPSRARIVAQLFNTFCNSPKNVLNFESMKLE